MAEAKLSKKASEGGWTLVHSDEGSLRQTASTGKSAVSELLVKEPHYIAAKVGTGVEQAATSIDKLNEQIESYEASQPLPEAEQNQMTEEERILSAKATLHQAVTAGARVAVDVDLTKAADKSTPKNKRFAAHPEIQEVPGNDPKASVASGSSSS